MEYLKTILAGIVGGILVLAGSAVIGPSINSFGATAPTTTFSATIRADSGVRVGGTNGTTVTFLKKGTCSLVMSNFTVAASSSVAADCAVTGAVTGDTVFAEFATSSPNGSGWLVSQSSASSTSGFVTLRIVNNTGVSAVIPASVASTTQYLLVR